MTTLLAIFAHPDDEGVVSGTLAWHAQRGDDVYLACATRGEAGEISDPMLAANVSLGAVREAELREACRILGIHPPHFLNYRDSGMDGTPENDDPYAFIQADPEEVIGRIIHLLHELQPEIVITFEPFGGYGHPDHIAVSRYVTAAYDRVVEAADSNADSSWQPQRLYYAVVPMSMFNEMTEYAKNNGLLDEEPFEPNDAQREAEEQITHVLDMRDLTDLKLDAMWVHRTQFGEDNWFRKLPDDLMRDFWGCEHYIQVRPVPAIELRERPADTLFD